MEELHEIGQRLKVFLETKKMKVSELGRLSNMRGTQIYNIVKGKKYGVDKFIMVIRQLPELNLYWLLNAEGDMYREDPGQTGFHQQIDLLKKENERLQSLITYQEMSLAAYKRSIEMIAATNEDMRKIVDLYKTQIIAPDKLHSA